MHKLTIMMVGPEDFVSDGAREGWHAAGVQLLGPYPIKNVDAAQAKHVSGIVIDISEDADAVFTLSCQLDRQNIAFLYALNDASQSSRKGTFVVNGIDADIETILSALLKEDDEGLRH